MGENPKVIPPPPAGFDTPVDTIPPPPEGFDVDVSDAEPLKVPKEVSRWAKARGAVILPGQEVTAKSTDIGPITPEELGAHEPIVNTPETQARLRAQARYPQGTTEENIRKATSIGQLPGNENRPLSATQNPENYIQKGLSQIPQAEPIYTPGNAPTEGTYAGQPAPIPVEKVPGMVGKAIDEIVANQPITRAVKTAVNYPGKVADFLNNPYAFSPGDVLQMFTDPLEAALGYGVSATPAGAAFQSGQEALNEVAPETGQRVQRSISPLHTLYGETDFGKAYPQLLNLGDTAFQLAIFKLAHMATSGEIKLAPKEKTGLENIVRTEVTRNYPAEDVARLIAASEAGAQLTAQQQDLLNAISSISGGKLALGELFLREGAKRGIKYGKVFDVTPIEQAGAKYEKLPNSEMGPEGVREILRAKPEEKAVGVSFLGEKPKEIAPEKQTIPQNIEDILAEIKKKAPTSEAMIRSKLESGRAQDLTPGEKNLINNAADALKPAKEVPANPKAEFDARQKLQEIANEFKVAQTNKERYDVTKHLTEENANLFAGTKSVDKLRDLLGQVREHNESLPGRPAENAESEPESQAPPEEPKKGELPTYSIPELDITSDKPLKEHLGLIDDAIQQHQDFQQSIEDEIAPIKEELKSLPPRDPQKKELQAQIDDLERVAENDASSLEHHIMQAQDVLSSKILKEAEKRGIEFKDDGDRENFLTEALMSLSNERPHVEYNFDRPIKEIVDELMDERKPKAPEGKPPKVTQADLNIGDVFKSKKGDGSTFKVIALHDNGYTVIVERFDKDGKSLGEGSMGADTFNLSNRVTKGGKLEGKPPEAPQGKIIGHKTLTGRQIPPEPKSETIGEHVTVASINKRHRWLVNEAIKEAVAKKDQTSLNKFRAERVGKLSMESIDSMYKYLFGTSEKIPEELTIREGAKPVKPPEEGKKPKTPKAPKPPVGSNDFVSMPIKSLTRNLEAMQGRKEEYSKTTYNRIVDEVEAGTFDKTALPAIQAWEKGNVILSGHSRVKAFEDLAKGQVIDAETGKYRPANIPDKYSKKDFQNINTQIVRVATLEEAMKRAQESNAGSPQTVLENSDYVRKQLLPTLKGKELLTKLKNLFGKNANLIHNLAYLNPKGKMYDALSQLEGSDVQTNATIQAMGDWIGNARRSREELTDLHEGEMFDFLKKNYGEPGIAKTKADFNEVVQKHIEKNSVDGVFDPSKPLNLTDVEPRSLNEREYVQKIRAKDAQLNKAEQELVDKSRDIPPNNENREKILQPLREHVTTLKKELQELIDKRDAEFGKIRSQEQDLFGKLDESEKPKLPPEEVKKAQDDLDDARNNIDDIFKEVRPPGGKVREAGPDYGVRKTINQWEQEMHVKVLDPDGFNRRDPHLMERKFTKREFLDGLRGSTTSNDPRFFGGSKDPFREPFDEAKYTKAKFYFDKAVVAQQILGKGAESIISELQSKHGEKIAPYVQRYLEEIKDEYNFRRGQEFYKSTGKLGNFKRGSVRVVNAGHLPTPKEIIPVGKYEALDPSQRYDTNLALTRFEKAGTAFLAGHGTGFGKTFIILTASKEMALKTGKPSLIIVPNKAIIAGSYTQAAKLLGLDLKDPHFEIGTYDGLRNKTIGQGDYGLVSFDEAHNLKHVHALKTIAASKITARNKLFATATPMDGAAAASYFLAQITGVSEANIQIALGYRIVQRMNPRTGESYPSAELLKGYTWPQVFDEIIKLRDRAIEEGGMIRREYPFYGVIANHQHHLTPEQSRDQHRILDYWAKRKAAAKSPMAKLNAGGQETGELSRWLENSKAPTVLKLIQDRLSQGRSVIVVAEGYSDTVIHGLDDEPMSAILNDLNKELTRMNIPFSKVYGGGNKTQAVADFQSNKNKVVLMTPGSGGAGVNLDDVDGNFPRTMVIVTSNFSGDVFDQVMGRPSRRNTASPVEVLMIVAPGGEGDSRRSRIIQTKMGVLKRIQMGEDPDRIDLETAQAIENILSGTDNKVEENSVFEAYRHKGGRLVKLQNGDVVKYDNLGMSTDPSRMERVYHRQRVGQLLPGESRIAQRFYKAGQPLYKSSEFIDSPDVSASIFRWLEDETLEHIYAVHINEEGKEVAQHISTGVFNSADVNYAAIKHFAEKFGTKQLLFYHNHTGGGMDPSPHDRVAWRKLRNLFGQDVTVHPGIIIDIRDGLYTYFTDEQQGAGNAPHPNKKYPIKVLTLSRQKYIQDVNKMEPITDPMQAVAFASALHFGPGQKLGLMVLNAGNKQTALHFPTEFPDLSTQPSVAQTQKLRDEVMSLITDSAGVSGIIVTNQQMTPALKKMAVNLREMLREAGVPLLDFVSVEPGSGTFANPIYYSSREFGLFPDVKEEAPDYGLFDEPKKKAETGVDKHINEQLKKGNIDPLRQKMKALEAEEADRVRHGKELELNSLIDYQKQLRREMASGLGTPEQKQTQKAELAEVNRRIGVIKQDLDKTDDETLFGAGPQTTLFEPSPVYGKAKTAFKKWFGDSKVVDEKGSPLIVYHGSGTKIEEFKYEFTNQGNDQYGSGFYFTTSKNQAEGYTKNRISSEKEKLGGEDNPNVIPVYLSIQSPLDADTVGGGLTKNTVGKLLDRSPIYREALMNFADVDYEGESKARSMALDAYYLPGPAKGGDTPKLQGLFAIANDFFPDHIKEFNEAIRDVMGYDGVVKTFPDGTKHYVAFFPTQIKSATGNRGTFDPNEPSILKEEAPAYGTKAKPFFSPTQKLIEEKMPEKFSRDQLQALLKTAKQDEVKWTGLEDFAKTKESFTKKEVLDYLRANEVRVEETHLSDDKFDAELNELKDAADAAEQAIAQIGRNLGAVDAHFRVSGTPLRWMYHKGGQDHFAPDDKQDDLDRLHEIIQKYEDRITDLGDEYAGGPPEGATRHSGLVLPGAEEGTYRELLLKLPNKHEEAKQRQNAEYQALKKDVQKRLGVDRINNLYDQRDKGNLTAEEKKRLSEIDAMEPRGLASQNYHEPHWPGEDNVIAHVRFNSRKLSDGGKTLFVEEFQGKWAQDAHRYGTESSKPKPLQQYNPEEVKLEEGQHSWSGTLPDGRSVNVGKGVVHSEAAAREYIAKYLNKEALENNRILETRFNRVVPDAPFLKGTGWQKLVMRRMVRYAAENGYDSISWTTGDQQNERYSLSQHVKSIDWSQVRPGYGQYEQGARQYVVVELLKNEPDIALFLDENGKVLRSNDGRLKDKDLADIIGKETASKILDQKAGSLSGEGLELGGEGKKALYDKIFVDIANDIGKPFGAKVDEAKIKTGIVQEPYQVDHLPHSPNEKKWRVISTTDSEEFPEWFSTREEAEASAEERNKSYAKYDQSVHSLPITPEMRKSVVEKGQALFEQAPEYGKKGVIREIPEDIDISAADLPFTLGGLDKINPVMMPELIKIAEHITGKRPLLNKMKSYLGYFMPMGQASRIALDKRIAKDPRLLAQVLAHEIGHGVDWMDNKFMERGNLIGRLLSVMTQFRKNNFPDGFLKDATNKQLREELINLTQYWKPFDVSANPNYTKYRHSAVELYADFMSVLLNAPAEAKNRAPKFYNKWFEFLDRKPSVMRQFARLQNMIANPQLLGESRHADITSMFSKSEDVMHQQHLIALAGDKSVWFHLKSAIFDKNAAALEARKKLIQAGKVEPLVEGDPRFALEENDVLSVNVQGYMRELDPVLRDINAKGTMDLVGAILFLDRIQAGDRWEYANPLGHIPGTAAAQLDYLEKQDPEKFAQAREQVDKFHKWFDQIRDLMAEDMMTPEQVEATAPMKDVYATYRVTKYMKDWVSAGLIAQSGTFEDIGNPFTATTLKAVSMIRAARRNQFKKEIAQQLLDNKDLFNEDVEGVGPVPQVEEAKVTTVPGKPPYVKPPNNPHLGTIMWKDGGKWKAAYVDKYIANSFDFDSSASLANAASVSKLLLNNKLWRPLLIALSPGFQARNLPRDFFRTYKGLPQHSFLDLLKAYRDAIPHAKKRARGVYDELIVRMEKEGALNVTLSELMRSLGGEEKEIEALMHRFGMNLTDLRPGWQKNPVGRSIAKIFEALEYAGNVIETIPKVAAYSMLDDMEPRKRATWIRNYIGTPNPKRRGTMYIFSNNLILFSNINKEGWRSDFGEQAVMPQTRAGWWWRTVMLGIMPKLLFRMAMLGVFGAWMSTWANKQDKYRRRQNMLIPVGETANGEGVSIVIPHDESTRVISGLFDIALDAATKEQTAGESLSEGTQFLMNQAPFIGGAHPMFTIGGAWSDYMNGRMPRDAFRGYDILTDDQLKAGGAEAWEPMLKWTINQTGLTHFDIQSRFKEEPTWEQSFRVIPGLSALTSVTSMGEYERAMRAMQRQAANEAEARIEKKERITESAKSGESMKDFLMKERPKTFSEVQELYAMRERLMAKGSNDPIVRVLAQGTSNAQKRAAMKALQGQVPDENLMTLYDAAEDTKIISAPVRFDLYIDLYNGKKTITAEPPLEEVIQAYKKMPKKLQEELYPIMEKRVTSSDEYKQMFQEEPADSLQEQQ